MTIEIRPRCEFCRQFLSPLIGCLLSSRRSEDAWADLWMQESFSLFRAASSVLIWQYENTTWLYLQSLLGMRCDIEKEIDHCHANSQSLSSMSAALAQHHYAVRDIVFRPHLLHAVRRMQPIATDFALLSPLLDCIRTVLCRAVLCSTIVHNNSHTYISNS